MITDEHIQTICVQVNAFAGQSAVWINESGTLKTAPFAGTGPRQRGKYVGTYLRVTFDELADDIRNVQLQRSTINHEITDPQIEAVFRAIVAKPRALTIVWICPRTGYLKCSSDGPGKWPVTEQSPTFVGIYNRQTTLPDLTEDALHAFAELRRARAINTPPPRKHRAAAKKAAA